jgi:hypothetical protein
MTTSQRLMNRLQQLLKNAVELPQNSAAVGEGDSLRGLAMYSDFHMYEDARITDCACWTEKISAEPEND